MTFVLSHLQGWCNQLSIIQLFLFILNQLDWIGKSILILGFRKADFFFLMAIRDFMHIKHAEWLMGHVHLKASFKQK